MKNILSLFVSLFLGVATLVGCEKDPKTDDQIPTPTITFECGETLNIGGDAAPVVAYFTIENRDASTTPSAKCDAEWVSELEVIASVVKFQVSANENRLPRQATITLSCGGSEAMLLVVQSELSRRYDLFPLLNNSDIPYRIPAVAVTNDGTILAAADYRHSGADIGVINNGRIDLHIRRSQDNGVTWDAITPIIEGQGASSPDFMNVGYGDPCIVADRLTPRVLLMSCAGNVSYQAGTRQRHQCIARFYSEDGGLTWGAPVDIAESIYSKFDNCSFGPVNAMFVASGRIMQSRTTKIADYYRLYCAVIMRDRSNTPKNFVLYSDDFGLSWEVLGGVSKAPISGNCDEPKVEELPDGSILLSSRWNGGRYFNIYRFEDAVAATGTWGSAAFSGSSNNGVEARENSTNGEVLIIPARRVADDAKVDLLLQSVPLGPGRKSVGIYYKSLEYDTDYASPSAIASNWEGVYQVTTLNSAYSTMIWQHDDRLAFLWEETTYCEGLPPYGGYTIAYDCFTLEKVTNGEYRYCAE